MAENRFEQFNTIELDALTDALERLLDAVHQEPEEYPAEYRRAVIGMHEDAHAAYYDSVQWSQQ